MNRKPAISLKRGKYRTKVTIDDQQEVAYALSIQSIGTEVNDLG